MPIHLYINPRIGNGILSNPDPLTWLDSTGPFRPLAFKYLNYMIGERYENYEHPVKNICLTLINASSGVLDTFESLVGVTPVIPIRATDLSQFRTILDTPFSSYPIAWRNAARAKMESIGIDTTWITASHTMRNVIRFMVKVCVVSQVLASLRLSNASQFLAQNLDSTVASIPAVQRNEIGTWLTSRGMDISWITGTTTVRQIIVALPWNVSGNLDRTVIRRLFGEVL